MYNLSDISVKCVSTPSNFVTTGLLGFIGVKGGGVMAMKIFLRKDIIEKVDGEKRTTGCYELTCEDAWGKDSVQEAVEIFSSLSKAIEKEKVA